MLVCPFCRIVLAPTEPACPRDARHGIEQLVEPLPPELAARFTAVAPFARGDTGTLYVADEPQAGRRGLLKVLHPVGAMHTAERQRVKRELVKQATLTSANLAMPSATGEAGDLTWLFRPLIEGESLRVRLARDGALPVPEALAIAAQLASALDELHRAGLLQRDLKPGHVILAPQAGRAPRAVLVDAGVAAHVRSKQVFDVLGTAAYVSPEQATGKLVSFRSDLYALGCVLFEMVAGRPPFEGEDADVLEAHATRPLPPLPAQLPAGAQALLQSLLAREPRERPFSAQQVRRSLEPFLPEASGAPDAAAARPPRAPSATLLGLPVVSSPAPSTSTPATGAPVTSPQKPRSSTMLGMPAVLPPAPTVSKPPPPPPPPPAPGGPVLLGEPQPSKPPPPPPPPSFSPPPPRDATDELAALDADQADSVLSGGGDDLDYDDLAETKAVDVQSVLQQGLAAASSRVAPPPSLQGFAPVPQGFAPAPQGFAPGAAPLPTPASGAPSSPSVQTSPGATSSPAPVKKKSKIGLFLLLGLLGFCGLASAVGVGGYLYVKSKAEEALDASLGALAAAPTAPGAPAEVPPFGDPGLAVAPPIPGAAEPPAAAEAAPAEVEWSLNTEPAGARVTVAGRSDAWTTPATLRLPPGTYTVTMTAEGHAPSEQVVDMRANGGSFFSLGRSPEAAPPVVAVAEPERSGSERSGGERGTERSGSERSGGERGTERSGNERSGGERSGGAAAAEAPAAAAQSPFDALREAARGHFAAGRYREASAVYERAAALNPSHAGTFAGLGASRLRMNDARGAVVAYEKAVQLQPTSAPFLAALGRAHLGAGNRAGARAAFQRALSLDPNNGAAREGMQQTGG